ncbi:hypothetical protein L6452_37230 [Arctium lappa]|uniref:Uncharacterized protein n=1 Tax=Arctium lappa TaxID=4217 RepID=A0ACB8Y335_ARCLA|nr:hypothetical protein L6452_37230 [Arctium lappa]
MPARPAYYLFSRQNSFTSLRTCTSFALPRHSHLPQNPSFTASATCTTGVLLIPKSRIFRYAPHHGL